MTSAWTGADLRDHFNERAGILEFDAGMSRPEAEARAMGEIMQMMAAAPTPPVRAHARTCVAPVNKTPGVNKTIPKGGRPKVHEDRAAYRREWMRRHRARAA